MPWIADKTFSPKCDIFFKLPPNSGHLSITEKCFKIRRCPLFRGFTVTPWKISANGWFYLMSENHWIFETEQFSKFQIVVGSLYSSTKVLANAVSFLFFFFFFFAFAFKFIIFVLSIHFFFFFIFTSTNYISFLKDHFN